METKASSTTIESSKSEQKQPHSEEKHLDSSSDEHEPDHGVDQSSPEFENKEATIEEDRGASLDKDGAPTKVASAISMSVNLRHHIESLSEERVLELILSQPVHSTSVSSGSGRDVLRESLVFALAESVRLLQSEQEVRARLETVLSPDSEAEAALISALLDPANDGAAARTAAAASARFLRNRMSSARHNLHRPMIESAHRFHGTAPEQVLGPDYKRRSSSSSLSCSPSSSSLIGGVTPSLADEEASARTEAVKVDSGGASTSTDAGCADVATGMGAVEAIGAAEAEAGCSGDSAKVASAADPAHVLVAVPSESDKTVTEEIRRQADCCDAAENTDNATLSSDEDDSAGSSLRSSGSDTLCAAQKQAANGRGSMGRPVRVRRKKKREPERNRKGLSRVRRFFSGLASAFSRHFSKPRRPCQQLNGILKKPSTLKPQPSCPKSVRFGFCIVVDSEGSMSRSEIPGIVDDDAAAAAAAGNAVGQGSADAPVVT